MEELTEENLQSPKSPNSKRVHVTRNNTRKKPVMPEDLPIMEVFQKIQDLKLKGEEGPEEAEAEQEMPSTLQMTMENADNTNEPIDFHCEAVKKEDGSVQYECRFSKETTKFPRVTGKFSLNVPYVVNNPNLTDHDIHNQLFSLNIFSI